MMEDSNNSELPKKLADFYSTLIKFRVQENKQKSSPPPIELFEHVRKDDVLQEQAKQDPFIDPVEPNERKQIELRIRKAMEFGDTLLLYLPSIPLLFFAISRRGKYTRRYSAIWTLLGIYCHYLKVKHGYKWLGLFLNPTYILLGEGIQFNNWKTGLIYSFSCFVASIVFLRISGAIARLT